MKLLVAIIQDQDSARLSEQLVDKGFRSTKLSSTGGFLRAGNTTLLIGVEEPQVDEVISIIQQTCPTREQLVSPLTGAEALGGYAPMPIAVQVGGAIIFVLNVEQFVNISKPKSEQ
jgi:uncharacterized protein YaaQ